MECTVKTQPPPFDQSNKPENAINPGTFHIGLSMAGAISAGAYTAGVFDMLMEALEAWQVTKDKEKDLPAKTVPTHNVIISVISGASAGG